MVKQNCLNSLNELKVLVFVVALCPFGYSAAQAQVVTPRVAGADAEASSAATVRSESQGVPAAAEKDITIFGARIHYAEAGAGPTVILLHGLGGSAQNWAFNIAALAAKFHVVVPDQVGFGRSDKPIINYRIGTYVDFLDQFCKQLKIERASFVGVSMGGWVAAAFAIAHPDRVERLVLVDAAGFVPPNFDTRTLVGLNPSTRAGMKQLASIIFYNKAMFTNDAVIDQMMAQRINAGDGYTIRSISESIERREDILDDRLAGITQPTLIIWGREDLLIKLADGERFKKEISGSTLLVFDQCGHVPNVEKAVEFNAAVLKFLTPAAAN